MRERRGPKPPVDARRDEREGFLSRVLTKLNSLWVRATYPFAGLGRGVEFHYASEIARYLAPRLCFGNGVVIGRNAWLTCGMEDQHEIKINIEDDCRIGAGCSITCKNSILLERGVVLAPGVLVMDHGHAYEDVNRPIKMQGPTPGGRIRIGEGCRIGEGATIVCERGELVLGRNCVVAPDAVVVRSVPANSQISGNLARSAQNPDSSGPAPGLGGGKLARQEH